MPNGLRDFWLVTAGLFLLRLFFGYVTFPIAVAEALSLVSAVLFVGLPVYAMFRAASHGWDSKVGVRFLVVGALLHVGGLFLLNFVAPRETTAGVVFMAVGQTGILVWTLGLGALLSLAIRDKNLMIPVAIFLVGFDMFLVFNPSSPTRIALDAAPGVTQNFLASVPQAKSVGAPKAGVQDLAQVGPADMLFAATFFALMFRFGMRAKQTLYWMAPVLVVYLLLVVYFGHVNIGPLSLAMLPAMVPIGLTVLLVNWRHFKLQGQEVVGVVLVALLSVGLAWFGVYRANQARTPQEQPVEPLPSDGGPVLLEPEGSPGQGL